MTNGLSGAETKFVTYLVYVLLTLLTITTGWQAITLNSLPDKYVRLERYTSDQNKVCTELNKVDSKLDRLLNLFIPPTPGR